MAQIDDHTKRGLDTAYSDTGAYNALDFAMEQKLRNGLTTSFVAGLTPAPARVLTMVPEASLPPS